MSGHKVTALSTLITGGVITFASFGPWVQVHSLFATAYFRGNGAYSSSSNAIMAESAAWEGWPIGWVTAPLGVFILAASALHLLEMLYPESGPKSLVVPGSLVAIISVTVMIDKEMPLGIPHEDLSQYVLSSGSGLVTLLVASVVTIFMGLLMVVMYD